MSTSRPVRIPRSRTHTVARVPVGAPMPSTRTVAERPVERRRNVAGFQRALRLALVYLSGIALIYALFVGYTLTVPITQGAGAGTDLLFFGIVALAFAIAGTLLALHSVPRAIELSSTAIVVLGRWGVRTEWTPRGELELRVVRRFPAGLLSSEPVTSVELSLPGRPPRTYLVTEGLIPRGP